MTARPASTAASHSHQAGCSAPSIGRPYTTIAATHVVRTDAHSHSQRVAGRSENREARGRVNMSESTVIGCTRRSEPKLSAAACSANPRSEDRVPPSQYQLKIERIAACAPDSP